MGNQPPWRHASVQGHRVLRGQNPRCSRHEAGCSTAPGSLRGQSTHLPVLSPAVSSSHTSHEDWQKPLPPSASQNPNIPPRTLFSQMPISPTSPPRLQVATGGGSAFYSFSTSWLIRWHKYNKKTANWRLAVVQSTNSKTESNKLKCLCRLVRTLPSALIRPCGMA